MKTIALLVCLVFFAGCTAKNEIEYTVSVGDRSNPQYDKLRLGQPYDFNSRLTLFSAHSGSTINITLNGKNVAHYDGSAPVSIVIKGGYLEISGKANSDIFAYVATGDTKHDYIVWFKKSFRKGDVVYYTLDLPKEFSGIRTNP